MTPQANVNQTTQPQVLCARGAARYIGVEPNTLAVWRMRGGGPAYLRLSDSPQGRVYYRVADLDRWLEERVRRNTASENFADTISR